MRRVGLCLRRASTAAPPRRSLALRLPGLLDAAKPLPVAHAVRRRVDFSPREVYEVVNDVERYPEFVPFCEHARVTRPINETEYEAELEVGFRVFSERYTSHVTALPHSLVRTRCIESRIFSHLESEWRFSPEDSGARTWIDFRVDFAVHSPLHAQAVRLFFGSVAVRQVDAFASRCEVVYGRPANSVDSEAQVAPPHTAPPPHQTLVVQPPRATAAAAAAAAEAAARADQLTDEELAALRALFRQHCDAQGALQLGGFARMCETMRKRHVVFHRFRDRYAFKAAATAPAVAATLFGEFRKPLTWERFCIEMASLSKGSPAERLVASLARSLSGGNATKLRTLRVSPVSLQDAAVRHFRLQFLVLREVLPDMVMRSAEDLQRSNPEVIGDSVSAGVKSLGMLGLMQDVSAVAEVEIVRAVESSVSALPRGADGLVSVGDWCAEWEARQGHLTDLSGVPAMSTLIQWAFVTDKPRESAER